MKKNKKVALGILAVLGIVIAVSIAIAVRNREKEVSVKQVESYTVPPRQHVFVDGSIEPREVQVFGLDSSKGRVETVHVTNGETVEAGKDIVTYKRDEITNQIRQIQSQVGELRALGSEPSVQSQIRNLESQLSELRKNETTVEKSDIKGKVYIENVTAQEGITLEKISVHTEDLIVKGSVGERDVLKLQEGTPAELTIVSSNEKTSGIIESISTRPSVSTETIPSVGGQPAQSLSEYEVLIALENQQNLKEGFHVQAKVIDGESRTLIPSDAVVEQDSKTYVYTVEDGAAKKNAVEISWLEESVQAPEDSETILDVIVVKGVRQGQEVILNPGADLKEGDRVE